MPLRAFSTNVTNLHCAKCTVSQTAGFLQIICLHRSLTADKVNIIKYKLLTKGSRNMVVCTMTKKQIMRIATAVLIALAVILTVVFAVFGSVTASADSGKKPICSVERGDNKVAITFDCAWDAPRTDDILSALSDNGAKATFFVTGEFCDTHADAVRRISTAGHSVQNGSDKNIHAAGMNVNDLIADTNAAAKKIKTVTGKAPAFYRTSYGDYDDKSLTTLEGMGYRVMLWSVDSKDLDDPDAVSVKKRIADNAVSGSVLLFHIDSDTACEALASVITALRQKGLEPVTLDELVYDKDYTVNEKGVQIHRPALIAVAPIMYSDNSALDAAFEKMRVNLTIQEIYDLSSVGRVALVDKIKSFLNDAELYAVKEATYEELKDCYGVLVYAAERYGAGGAYAETEYEAIPQIVSPRPEYTEEYNDEPDITDESEEGKDITNKDNSTLQDKEMSDKGKAENVTSIT